MSNVTALRFPTVTGKVTPPSDLGPAISALSEIGKAYLDRRCKGLPATPKDIALAADFERGELNGQS